MSGERSSGAPVPGLGVPMPGLLGSLRAGADGATQAGFLVGLLDGVRALLGGAADGPLAAVGLVLASGLLHAVTWLVLGALGGVLLHPLLRRASLGRRIALAFGLGLGLGVFLQAYWWSRPFVFYGTPALSPPRLAATALIAALSLATGLVLLRLWLRAPERLRALLPRAALLGCVVGGLFLLTQRQGEERGAIGERNRELPSVLLIVVDALRADVLGAYGSERVKTPNIDALAERGVVFENAFAQAPYTWTSFGSFLTGKYPRRHGLMKMAPGYRMPTNITLPWHLKTGRLRGSEETMRDEDWASGTFMTGTLSNDSGLMLGFDSYFEALVGHELAHNDVPWSVFRSDLLLYRLKNKLGQKLDSSLVMTTATGWLGELGTRRFVAMVHLYSTHTPYDPPQRFKDMYLDPEYDGPIRAFYAEHRYAIESGEYEPTPEDEQRIRDLYYAGTSQADADVGRLLALLEAQGVLDDTLVILTSDHGEELGEHRRAGRSLWEHNYMYETNLRIPLVMAWPAGLPGGVRVDAIVDSIDVLPTLCDLLDLELPEDEFSAPDEAIVDGASLVPLVRGEAERVREFSFAENGVYMSIRGARWKLVLRRELVGLPASELALHLEDPLAVRLFDLAADPGEHANLAGDPGAAAELARLAQALGAWSATMPAREVVRSHRDREATELMSDLGYAEMLDEEGED
jgi:choline-sulfatase